eukprot:5861157-Amphidinium_carterae.1
MLFATHSPDSHIGKSHTTAPKWSSPMLTMPPRQMQSPALAEKACCRSTKATPARQPTWATPA